MSRRRSLARRLKQETKGGRHKKLDMVEWLSRPKAFVSREEAYVLIRQYHHDVERKRFLRNPFLFVPYALFLILWTPVRYTARGILWLLDRKEKEWERKEKDEPGS